MDAQTVILSLFGIIIGVGVGAILTYWVVKSAVTDGMKKYWEWRVAEDAKRTAARTAGR